MFEKTAMSREIHPQSHFLAETLTCKHPDVIVAIQADEDGWDTIVARRDLPDGTIQLEAVRIRPASQDLLQRLFIS